MDDDMPANLLQIVESTTLHADEITARTQQIHADMLSMSEYIDASNFTCIHRDDLKILFTFYDSRFFEGQIKESLGTVSLHFSLSKRMTKTGGKTVHCLDKASGTQWYEIGVSTTLLFQCFTGDDHRPIRNSGIVCHDRLDALQRVMEHELVHLIEMLLWDKSSCAKPRFHSITLRFFGHTENKHQLITPKEKAIVKYGIKPGVKVRFRFDGVQHKGFVNRINKRATVLVEDRKGVRYSNGKYYVKFYVPVQKLEVLE
ncbi:MAG: hypothetical protein GTO53_09535 [Planctomycetales bacterium]|nr:hypothetical protein [Planctomycetales bacterium]NIM09367.1 hypothetical protein [Planctomycetales bacterium]NIN08834.1 hypothetical protein [Planctomycetales bacterium]NIN77951.1 hypothetical protein [Planctomycetales bacterium]NIO35134.1 hypothetical protein [Planctomycetales bacterium]